MEKLERVVGFGMDGSEDGGVANRKGEIKER
jgi:hypothetical protein